MIKLDEVKNVKFNVAKITRIALSTAFIVIGAQLAIPTIPPVTLQTLCIFITAVILSPTEALISSLIYVLLGIVGAPVFSSFSGGIGIVLNVGGGFIISFPVIAFVVSTLGRKFRSSAFTHAFTFSIATLIAYIFGALWIDIMGYYEGSFWKMLTVYVLPFLPFDAIKIAVATLCSMKLEKIFKNGKKKTENNKA